jgi:acetylglutamate kinase
MATDMQEAIEKAAVLVEALPYIQSFRGKVVVIKIGGSAMEDDEILASILQDIVFVELVGMRPLLVHGGGKFITQEMKASGLSPRFVQGHRVTDEAGLQIVEKVLLQVNEKITRMVEELGGQAKGLTFQSGNWLTAERLFLETNGQRQDLGFVGKVSGIDRAGLKAQLTEGVVLVLSPLAKTDDDEVLNINADSAAGALACELAAEKLVFLSDTHGIMTDPDDESSLASSLTQSEIDLLIQRKVIDAGMLPKVEAARMALEAGVSKVHIIDGRIRHSLLLEIFTDKGIGTQILP